jgi:hypothetical protein
MSGPKSIDEVYRGRNLLAIAHATQVYRNGGKAGYHTDSTGRDGWPVVWFEALTDTDAESAESYKQVGHHVRPGDVTLLRQSPLPEERPPGGYDGHTRTERLNRLTEYITR